MRLYFVFEGLEEKERKRSELKKIHNSYILKICIFDLYKLYMDSYTLQFINFLNHEFNALDFYFDLFI